MLPVHSGRVEGRMSRLVVNNYIRREVVLVSHNAHVEFRCTLKVPTNELLDLGCLMKIRGHSFGGNAQVVLAKDKDVVVLQSIVEQLPMAVDQIKTHGGAAQRNRQGKAGIG